MVDSVSKDEWVRARKLLLEKEKELTHLRDEVAVARQRLPWHRVETTYQFSGPDGDVTLAELFGDKSQLVIYHFMYGPGWQEGCKSCSFWADQYDTISTHIAARDVALAVVSRAPWQEFQSFKERMAWRFTWVSSAENTFNMDYHVSHPEGGEGEYNYRTTGVMEEMPGLSVFAKDDNGEIFHTYSCYSRGLDALNATYQVLDLVPKGRDEQDLGFSMGWVQLHDQYES